MAAGSVLAAPCLAIGGFAMYLRSQADQLEQITVTGLEPADTPPATALLIPSTTTDMEVLAQDLPISVPLNILVAGVDRRPDGAEVLGSRADTIAVVRIDPNLGRVSILSLPRDLWVTGPDDRAGRLNSFTEDGALVPVVSSLLNIDLNHYIEVDFDGFESLIDIVGGVSVPFDHPVRDRNTGFVADEGCIELSGSEALAYVRSRKLEEFDQTDGTWTIDPRSDLGRIARQQDLMERVYTAVLSEDYGPVDRVRLLDDVVDDLTVDSGLDLDGVRAIFNAAALIGPAGFSTYDITDGLSGTVIDGQAVLIAEPDSIAAAVNGLLGRDDPVSQAAPTASGDVAIAPVVVSC